MIAFAKEWFNRFFKKDKEEESCLLFDETPPVIPLYSYEFDDVSDKYCKENPIRSGTLMFNPERRMMALKNLLDDIERYVENEKKLIDGGEDVGEKPSYQIELSEIRDRLKGALLD